MSTPPSWMPICRGHGSRWLWKGVSRETFPPVRRLSRVKTVLPWRTARATLIWRGADSGAGEGGGHCPLLARRIPPRVDLFHERLIYVRFTYVRLTFWPPIADVADCGLSCEGGLPVDLRLAARLGLPVESGLRGGARSGRRFALRGAGIRVVVLPAHGHMWMHFLQESLRWYWCPISSVQPFFTHVSRETARATVVAPRAVISR